jgi:MFS family permease
VAEEFGFSAHAKDAKLGGEVSLGFFMVGGVCGLVVGWLADRASIISRPKLFAMVVLLGELSCIGTYRSSTYPELLFCRIMTGISIGGASPIMYSVLGDCWPSSSRVHVSTLLGLSMGSGAAIGQIIAAILGPIYGWRFPFLIVAVPAIVCAVLLLTSVTDPPRGGFENVNPEVVDDKDTTFGSPSTEQRRDHTALSTNMFPIVSDGRKYDESHHHTNSFSQPESALVKALAIFQTRTVSLVMLQGMFGCIPWSIISVFLTDYLSADLGMSVARATGTMTVFGIGCLSGQIFGGWIGQRLYNKDPRLQCLLIGSTTLCAMIPILVIINTETRFEGDGNISPFYLVTFIIGGFLATIGGPNVRSILQNVTIAETRGVAFATFNLCDDVGKGGGPYLVAYLVKLHGSRRPAFSVGVLGWLISSMLLFVMSCTVVSDEKLVNSQTSKNVAEKMEKHISEKQNSVLHVASDQKKVKQ